jgi:menaquinone-dependent protoporphyrinogen oxidase
MKVLILYATHFGQTRAIAMKISERLRMLGIESDVLDAKTAQPLPAPDGYDAVVLGSRVELGKHASDIVGYIRSHRDALERVPTAFFSVSMAASKTASTDANGYLTAMFDELSWMPGRSIAIAGGLPYRRYNWFLRFFMKRIAKREGNTTDTTKNHELTDWTAVRVFADDIAALLPRVGPSPSSRVLGTTAGKKRSDVHVVKTDSPAK